MKAFINKGESHSIAECLAVNGVTQGETLDETMSNLQKAVALYLEGEGLVELPVLNYQFSRESTGREEYSS